jgi:hypothetical protein
VAGRRAAGRRAAGRRAPAAAADAPSCRRADPGPGAAPDRADPMVPAFHPPGLAPAGGTGDRRAAEPGARSAADTGARASVRHSPGLRSPNPRSSGPRSRGLRSRGRRCPARRSARSRRPGFPEAGNGPAAAAAANGRAGGGPAGTALPRGAAAAGRTRRRHRPARSGSRGRPAGRRGGRPGVFAWAGHRHRGPGRCRHVPPGTSWTLLSSAAGICPYVTSVGREKSPAGPGRSIVINCT